MPLLGRATYCEAKEYSVIMTTRPMTLKHSLHTLHTLRRKFCERSECSKPVGANIRIHHATLSHMLSAKVGPIATEAPASVCAILAATPLALPSANEHMLDPLSKMGASGTRAPVIVP